MPSIAALTPYGFKELDVTVEAGRHAVSECGFNCRCRHNTDYKALLRAIVENQVGEMNVVGVMNPSVVLIHRSGPFYTSDRQQKHFRLHCQNHWYTIPLSVRARGKDVVGCRNGLAEAF